MCILLPDSARIRGRQHRRAVRTALRFAPAPYARERLAKTLVVEGFEEIVDRTHFKRLERVMVVGGDENDERQGLGIERSSQRHPIHRVDLDIEEQQMRRPGKDRLKRRPAFAVFPHDVQVRLARAVLTQGAPRRRLIVNDDYIHHGQ
jgi:hypothetical protein